MTPHALETGPLDGPVPDSATIRQHPSLHTVLREFGDRYPNPVSRAVILNELRFLLAGDIRCPADITTDHLIAWVTRTPANNSVRRRISTARVFYRWCARAGYLPPGTEPDIEHLVKQFPKTYGKQQGVHPARFLDRAEADRLLDACRDGTWVGSRDQLLIRLGLLGLRASELRDLTFGDLHPDGRIRFIGKSNRARVISPGPALSDMLERWGDFAQSRMRRPIRPDDALLPSFGPAGLHPEYRVARVRRRTPPTWRPLTYDRIYSIVVERARTAGLGHVAPHDLRRTGSNILHQTVTTDGAHVFDLLDIQRVLDHADPITTMKCYMTPMDTRSKDRAGLALD